MSPKSTVKFSIYVEEFLRHYLQLTIYNKINRVDCSLFFANSQGIFVVYRCGLQIATGNWSGKDLVMSTLDSSSLMSIVFIFVDWRYVSMLFYVVSLLLLSENHHNGKKELRTAWLHRQLFGSFSLNQGVLHCAEVVESKDCSWWWWLKTLATHHHVSWARCSTWLFTQYKVFWTFQQFSLCFPSFEKRNVAWCHRKLLCKSFPPCVVCANQSSIILQKKILNLYCSSLSCFPQSLRKLTK